MTSSTPSVLGCRFCAGARRLRGRAGLCRARPHPRRRPARFVSASDPAVAPEPVAAGLVAALQRSGARRAGRRCARRATPTCPRGAGQYRQGARRAARIAGRAPAAGALRSARARPTAGSRSAAPAGRGPRETGQSMPGWTSATNSTCSAGSAAASRPRAAIVDAARRRCRCGAGDRGRRYDARLCRCRARRGAAGRSRSHIVGLLDQSPALTERRHDAGLADRARRGPDRRAARPARRPKSR